VERTPNFSLGHNNSLWEEVLYLETNYSSFCYMVHALTLQLSHSLDAELCSVREEQPAQRAPLDRPLELFLHEAAELSHSLFTLTT